MQPNIEIGVSKEDGRFKIALGSDTLTKFVELDLVGYDTIFSDNYFDLIPGESKIVTAVVEDIDVEEFAKNLVMKSLYDAQI